MSNLLNFLNLENICSILYLVLIFNLSIKLFLLITVLLFRLFIRDINLPNLRQIRNYVSYFSINFQRKFINSFTLFLNIEQL